MRRLNECPHNDEPVLALSAHHGFIDVLAAMVRAELAEGRSGASGLACGSSALGAEFGCRAHRGVAV
jgi:hypothetical protein